MNIPKMMSIEELREARHKEANPEVTTRSKKNRENVKTAHTKEQNQTKKVQMKIQKKTAYFCLQGIKGVFAGKQIPLEDVVIIGRSREASNLIYPPNAPGISRQHCCIWVDREGVIKLQDLESTHGTYFEDGTKLRAKKIYQLNPGEWFYLASTREAFCVVCKDTEHK